MKVALISDLHGNLAALEAVLADIASEAVDRVVCLGDITDLGPQPRETIQALVDAGCASIMGNHDPFDGEPLLPVDVHLWSKAQLSDDELTWLRALPLSLDIELGPGANLLCVHGSPRSYDDQVLCDTPADALEAMVSDRAFSVMVCGHTHVQMMRRLGRRLFVNVGSVGMAFHAPFNGVPPRALPWAEYGVVRWNRGRLEVDLRRVEYELKRFRQAVRQSSMPDPDGWLTQWTA